MNGSDAVLILAGSGAVITALALIRDDQGLLVPAALFLVVALIVELLRADTPAEAAWYRNHQARPRTWRATRRHRR
jgi:hypothetical protein